MSACMFAPLTPPVARALTDEEVVDRIKLGETEFYELLVERYKRRFYAILRRILQNPNDAEDVLQQAHLRALQKFDQFEGRSNIVAWLTRVVINEAYTHLRRRHDSQPLEWDETSPKDFAAPEATPEQWAIQAQLRGILQSSITSLPHVYREVISLRLMGEMTTADTAAYLGISEQGVKTRLFRARRLLQRKMCDEHEGAVSWRI